MKQIAVFASGSGSNAENLYLFFEKHPDARVNTIVTDREKAGVKERMRRHGMHTHYFRPEQFRDGTVLSFLQAANTDLIVLAGYLRLVPESLLKGFQGRIINLHPALLPRHGGKGMFGMHVHEAVVASGDSKTGITVHFVNNRFDEGEIIAQYETSVEPGDTAEKIASKIHELEMKWLPLVVESVLKTLKDG